VGLAPLLGVARVVVEHAQFDAAVPTLREGRVGAAEALLSTAFEAERGVNSWTYDMVHRGAIVNLVVRVSKARRDTRMPPEAAATLEQLEPLPAGD